MLQKFKAARAAANSSVAPVPAPAPPSSLATVESLGQQLREVLPTRRVQSVSLCDHEANVLWLSEGALGPDEHMLVMESLEVLSADSSLPCHETALEDGRLSVFLPVRAPTGSLVGVAMILADSKSVGDDTLERMTAAPVRTIMQRLAVLLKPSGVPQATTQVEILEDPEPVEVTQASEVPMAREAPEPEAETDTEEASAAELELALVAEMEFAEPAPAAEPESEEISETIITAAEIASILELVPDELPLEPPATPAATAAPAPAAGKPAAAPARAHTPAPPAAKAPARPVAIPPAAADSEVADSGMLRLEFLAEPPVVRPPPNPTALAKKLQAASKAAEVAPTRAPRPLPTPGTPGRAAAPAPRPAAPAAKGKTLPPFAAPSAKTAPSPTRNPFEPASTHSRLSLGAPDDVVVLFESEPVEVPARPGAAATKAPPPARNAPPARPAHPTRMPVTRAAPPARTSPAVRTAPAPVAVPAAPAAPPPPVPAVTATAAPTMAAAAAPSAAADVSPPIDLVPYAKLRSGGQTRRFQVQPRAAAQQRDSAALDQQTLQQLLAWLGGNRAQWSSVPTTFTVNLSIATLEDERFLGRISAALNTHGISGETLGFEIAESLCVQQRAKVERFISQCERIGAWVAIDDFSFDSQVLPLLRSKALRMLKLDARLTAAALRDKLSQAMVVATVQAAKVLGIHCSAKKADSHASLQYLAAIGLDFAQGAVLSRVVPLDAIATVTDPRANGASLSENIE